MLPRALSIGLKHLKSVKQENLERIKLCVSNVSKKRLLWDEEKRNLFERLHDMERKQAGLVAGERLWRENYQAIKKGCREGNS